MGFEGSLLDFNIVSIFQVIKMEGQSGLLELVDQDEIVKVSFNDGYLIYAEGKIEDDTLRLKEILLGNMLISENDWKRVSNNQKATLRPYWDILDDYLSIDLLRTLVNIQITENIYRSLRLKNGRYIFTPVKSLRYRTDIMPNIDIDTILINGYRVSDEWNKVSNKIPEGMSQIVKTIGSIKDVDTVGRSWLSSAENEYIVSERIQLATREIAILSVIGKGKSVDEILESAMIDRFEAMQAILDLISKSLIAVAKKHSKKGGIKYDIAPNIGWMIVMLIMIIVFFAGFVYMKDSWIDKYFSDDSPLDIVREKEGRKELSKLASYVVIYSYVDGMIPPDIEFLSAFFGLSEDDIYDPWGRKYKLQIDQDLILLSSDGKDLTKDSDDIVYKIRF